MLEDMKLLVEIVQEFLKSWILVFVVFLFSSVILILAHISSISDTLSTMDMKTIVLIIWLISLAMLIVKGISEIVKRYREKRRIRDILKNALNYVITLPPAEKAVLKYIYLSSTNAVYLPYDNPAVLSLWHQGALRKVMNIIFQRKKTGCILYEMLPQLRKLLIDNYYLLNWSNIPYIAELDELQQG